MEWGEAISAVHVLESSGRRDIPVRGVQYDSRRVTAGDIFVAMRGETSDGNRFIAAAIAKGAAAILTDSAETFDELKRKQPELALAHVSHGRRTLAEISSAIYGKPEQLLKLTAVTGTNGKTTTAFLVEQMLRSAGRKCVLLGTIETHIGDEVRASEHTTPESRDILAVFADGVRAGCTEAVMEMSSHALDQERVWGMQVDVAIFTNLTQDHLDYHVTMERYAAAKARLFEGVGGPAPRIAIINLDDEYGGVMEEAAKTSGSTVWTYGYVQVHGWVPEFRAENIAIGSRETSFEYVTPLGTREVSSSLLGMINVSNLLAAMTAGLARGITLDDVVIYAKTLKPVPGRFETIPNELGITVVVDYAHTDDALANLIAIARDLVGPHGGQVITLFGCGGDRDKTKRPKMGRAAGGASDLVVITSDNPRSEEPMQIIDEVMLGVRETDVTFIVEEDRRAAIEIAIRSAKPGDIVLLAGKGHEKIQIFADGAVPFDDVEEAARVLRDLRSGATE